MWGIDEVYRHKKLDLCAVESTNGGTPNGWYYEEVVKTGASQTVVQINKSGLVKSS